MAQNCGDMHCTQTALQYSQFSNAAILMFCPCIIQNVQQVHTRVPSAIQNVINVLQTQLQTQTEQDVPVMKDFTILKQFWKLAVEVMKKTLLVLVYSVTYENTF